MERASDPPVTQKKNFEWNAGAPLAEGPSSRGVLRVGFQGFPVGLVGGFLDDVVYKTLAVHLSSLGKQNS